MHHYYVDKDKGWAWIVLMGAFLAMFLETGIVKALGVLLPILRQQFVTETWVVGLSIAMIPGFGAFTCPFGGALSKRLSPRVTVMIFSLLAAVGLFAASITSSVYMFMMSTLLTGFLIAAEAVIIGELATYFDEYYDVANAVSNMGLSVGVMIMPLLTQFLLDIYGWRGTMMMLGAFTLNIIVCGATLIPIRPTSIALDNLDAKHEDQSNDYDEECSNHRREALKIANIVYYFDLTLFKDINFLSILLYNIGSGYCFAGWLIYLVPHAMEIGFSPTAASALATSGGVGNLIASILYPFVKMKFSNKQLMYSMSILNFVALTIDPFFSASKSYVGLVVSSASFGFGRGMAIMSVYTLTKDTIERDKMTNAVIWMNVYYSVGSLVSGFLSGWIFDHSGSYTGSFLILGAMAVISVSLQFILDIQNFMKDTKYKSVSTKDPDYPYDD